MLEKQNINQWVDEKNGLVDDYNEIKEALKLLDKDYILTSADQSYVQNSNGEYVGIADQVHVRRRADDKIFAHLIIENRKLLLGKSKGYKIMRDSASELIPKFINGKSIKSQRSNIKDCKILNKVNIYDFVNALIDIKDLNINDL